MYGAAFTCRSRPASLCAALARPRSAPVEPYRVPSRRKHFYGRGDATTGDLLPPTVAGPGRDHAVSTSGIRSALPHAGDRPADACTRKPDPACSSGDLPAAFRPSGGSLGTAVRRGCPVRSGGTRSAYERIGAYPATGTLRQASEGTFGTGGSLALPHRGRLPPATRPGSPVAGTRRHCAACVRLARAVWRVASFLGCRLAAPLRSLCLLDLGGVPAACPVARRRPQRGVLAMDRGDSFPRSGFCATALDTDPAGRREPGCYRAQR